MHVYIDYLKTNEEVKELAKYVWENKEEGVHAWKPVVEGFVTIEAIGDEEGDYLLVQLVDKVDSLGYPFGNVLNFDILYEDEVNEL